MVEISQNFMAFSEYINFKRQIKWKIVSNFVAFLEKLNFNTHWFDAKLILSIQCKIISGSGGGPQGLCGYFVLQNKHGFECNRLKKRVKKLPFKNNMKRTAWWENKLEIFLHIAWFPFCTLSTALFAHHHARHFSEN